jgi:hypothetical protein
MLSRKDTISCDCGNLRGPGVQFCDITAMTPRVETNRWIWKAAAAGLNPHDPTVETY